MTDNLPYNNFSLTDIAGEEWKDIIGYEGRFKVSNLGRIKSLSRKVHRRNNSVHLTKDLIKKQRITKHGYLTVFLSINKDYSHKFVHKLVAIHFIDNPEKKPEVDHKFGCKLDNRYFSLRWATVSENKIYAYSLGLMSQQGERHASHKLTNKDVMYIFNSKKSYSFLCNKFNICRTTVSDIKIGKRWNHITGKKYKRIKSLTKKCK